MLIYPNCKINIGLRILDKRPDNFHNMETVFYPVNLCDIIEIQKSDKTSFQTSGLKIEGNEENICTKAYNLLSQTYDLPPVKIHLHKSIPIGAGLGGGSSDGAFTLTLLNKMFSLGLKYEKMNSLASRLGSDCSFFLKNKVAFAKEKGNVLENIKVNLKNYFIIIIKPDFSINTKEAYTLLSNSRINTEFTNNQTNLKNIIQNLPIEKWKDNIINDFEKVIINKYPLINQIKENLYSIGAVYASMSGSGSSVYGIFSKEPDETIFNKFGFVWKTKL